VSVTTSDWRARKKAATRATITEQALRLFGEKGYEATTVEEIAAAAGVSHMTFFRYFPTKEDVVLSDDYDPLIAGLIAARPEGERPIEMVRNALVVGIRALTGAERAAVLTRCRLVVRTPALRARMLQDQEITEHLIADALAARHGHPENDLRTRVISAACVAALTTVLLSWAENDGAGDLAALVDEGLDALSSG
jgi:AcrR family transcriptional regulator